MLQGLRTTLDLQRDLEDCYQLCPCLSAVVAVNNRQSAALNGRTRKRPPVWGIGATQPLRVRLLPHNAHVEQSSLFWRPLLRAATIAGTSLLSRPVASSSPV